MGERKIFIATAHPDDETMSLYHTRREGNSIDLCVAVNGGAGNIHGRRPIEIWPNPTTARKKADRIRLGELRRASKYMERATGGTVQTHLLALQDRGWRGGGIIGQEEQLKKKVTTILRDNEYSAYIFPLSLP